MSPWKGKEVAFAWERWLSGAGQERSGLRVSRWEVALGQWDWCSLSAMPQVCLGGVSVPISWEKKKKKKERCSSQVQVYPGPIGFPPKRDSRDCDCLFVVERLVQSSSSILADIAAFPSQAAHSTAP